MKKSILISLVILHLIILTSCDSPFGSSKDSGSGTTVTNSKKNVRNNSSRNTGSPQLSKTSSGYRKLRDLPDAEILKTDCNTLKTGTDDREVKRCEQLKIRTTQRAERKKLKTPKK